MLTNGEYKKRKERAGRQELKKKKMFSKVYWIHIIHWNNNAQFELTLTKDL